MNNLTQVQSVTICALVLMGIAFLAIGLYSLKQTGNMEGFLLGGRKVGPWLSAFSYGTSYFSAVIFIGYAGKHGWDIGIASLWIGIGNALLGCLLSWWLLAKRTRTMTKKLSAKTMPEFFEARFASRSMKIYAALIIFIFLVPYSAAVYKGLGSMFSVIFPGANVNIVMLIIAAFSSVYLVLGGYSASSKTDFLQGIIMIAGVIIMLIILINHSTVGGLREGYNKLRELSDAEGLHLTSLFGGSSFKFLAFNILLTSFGTWGLPQMVSKYYAISDVGSIKKATIVSTFFCLLIGVGAYLTGTMGRLFLGNTLPAGGYDYVVPMTLLTALGDANIFTTIVLAIIFLLLLSASMSTLSSVVLSSSSAVAVDLIPAIKKGFKGKRQMIVTRLLCLLFIALSYIFAISKISIIVNIMSFSWGVVAGCFIGPYVWGICSKRVTRAGAWSGMISGLAVVGILTLIQTVAGGFSSAISNAPIYGVIAMAVSVVIVPVVSLFTKKLPSKVISDSFDTQESIQD